jgi:molybdopterin-guanine dinucleotide biosynthesis protein A
LRACVVVTAGGASRRFGSDKTAADLAGSPVLGRLLADLPDDVPVVVVGPRADTPRAVVWTREDPPGGGPAAGLAAGCASAPGGTDVVVALAGDLPFAGPVVSRLLAALAADTDAVAAVGVTPDGRRQPLIAAYRIGPLLRALGPAPAGLSLRRVLDLDRAAAVAVTDVEALDVDTPHDLARARALVQGGDPVGPPAGRP